MIYNKDVTKSFVRITTFQLSGYLVLILSFLLFSCSSITEDCHTGSHIKEQAMFPQYDSIQYFSTEVTFEELFFDPIFQEENSEKDSIMYSFAVGRRPININEDFVSSLDSIGFNRTTISKTDYSGINEIFITRPTDECLMALACKPVYRDILVFYHNDKIIGVAKICFTCNQFMFRGAQGETDFFGYFGEFSKLIKILNPYLKTKIEERFSS